MTIAMSSAYAVFRFRFLKSPQLFRPELGSTFVTLKHLWAAFANCFTYLRRVAGNSCFSA